MLATQAERYFADDPNTCLVKLRQFGELLAQRAAARLGLDAWPQDKQVDLINRLAERGALDATTRQIFHELTLRMPRSHDAYAPPHRALGSVDAGGLGTK